MVIPIPPRPGINQNTKDACAEVNATRRRHEAGQASDADLQAAQDAYAQALVDDPATPYTRQGGLTWTPSTKSASASVSRWPGTSTASPP